MARKINRLTTRFVAALLERANRDQLRPEDYRRHADGGNLYLVVKENGALGWSFIYRWHGKPVEIGLDPARDVSLGSTRQKATPLREQLAAGVNPKTARKPKKRRRTRTATLKRRGSITVPPSAPSRCRHLESRMHCGC